MKKRFWLSGIIVLVLVIILSLPFIIGVLLQNQVLQSIQNLNNQNVPFVVNVNQYQRGWFTSTVNLQITPTVIDGSIKPITLHIHHGPIVLIDKRLHLALGSVSGQVQDQYLNANLQAWISMNHHLHGKVHLNAISISKPFGKLKLDAGDLQFFVPLNALQQFKFSGNLNNLQLADENQKNTSNIKNISWNIAATQLSDTSWNWQTSFAVGNSDFWLTDPDTKVVNHIALNSLQLQHLNFNSQQMLDLVSALQSNDETQWLKQTKIFANSLISANTLIQVQQLQASFDSFNLNLSIDSSWPNLPSKHSLHDLVTYQQLNADLSIPKLNFTDPSTGIVLNLQGFRVQNSGSQQQKSTLSLQIDNLLLKQNNEDVRLQKFLWQADSTLATETWHINNQTLCYQESCINNASLDFVSKNIRPEAINPTLFADLNEAIEQFSKDYNPAIFRQVLQRDLAPAISKDSDISFAVAAKIPNGKLSLSLHQTWPNYQTGKDIFATQYLTANLAIPTSLVDQVLQYRNNPGNVPYPNSLDLPAISQLANLISQWIENDYIIRYGSAYTLTLEAKGTEIKLSNQPVDSLNRGYFSFIFNLYPMSFKEFMRAAKHNNDYGQYYVGLQYAWGLGVNKDTGEAIEWLSRAAAQHNSSAALTLGGIYYKQHDYQQALDWFTQAAKDNDPRAQTALGYIYANGYQELQIKPSYYQAVYWYDLAAQQHYAPAEYRLAEMYEQGLGVPQDKAEAYRLYKAAAREVPAAREAVERLQP